MNINLLDYLINFSCRVGAKINYTNLQKTNLELLAYTKPPLICLDTSLIDRPRLHKCILAEEIGHFLFPPRPGHVTYHMKSYYMLAQQERDNLSITVAKDERLALQWGTSIVIPDQAFWEFAAQGPHELWEWIEHFNVEDWFLRRKIGLMRTKHHFKWREIIKRNATG